MNKEQLIRKVARNTGNTIVSTKEIINSTIEVIQNTISKEEIKFTGFGTFSSKAVAKRIMRNPSTGEEMSVPATRKVKFRAGTVLKEAAKS